MRRTPSAAEDRLDPLELIARISAEHSSPSVRTGRHHRRAASPAAAPTMLDSGPLPALPDAAADPGPLPAYPDTAAGSNAAAEEPPRTDPFPIVRPRTTDSGAYGAYTGAYSAYVDDEPGLIAGDTGLFTHGWFGAGSEPDPDTGSRPSVADSGAYAPSAPRDLRPDDTFPFRRISTAEIEGLVEGPREARDDADGAGDSTATTGDHGSLGGFADHGADARERADLDDRYGSADDDDDRPEADGPALAAADGPTGEPLESVVEQDRPEEFQDALTATGAVRAARRHRRRARRSLMRKFGPIAAGAAVILVAALIITLVRPAGNEPPLSADLVSSDAGVPQDPTVTQTSDTPGTVPAPAALAEAAKAARDRITTTARPPGTSAAGNSSAASPRPRATASASDGPTAAASRGWTPVGGDEFNGGLSGKWGLYDGAGHGGNGRRSPDAISVQNGVLVIRGDGNGTTGGMAWNEGRRFGKWEMRARFPSGDEQYHPVLLLWPTDMDWPVGGEIDFAETTSASRDVSFFLHYSSSNQQKYAKRNIDLTQWHNYAVEWTANGVKGYVDGQEWFSSTDQNTIPPGKMHAAIQLDYFPDGGSPRTSELQVDWMRMYS